MRSFAKRRAARLGVPGVHDESIRSKPHFSTCPVGLLQQSPAVECTTRRSGHAAQSSLRPGGTQERPFPARGSRLIASPQSRAALTAQPSRPNQSLGANFHRSPKVRRASRQSRPVPSTVSPPEAARVAASHRSQMRHRYRNDRTIPCSLFLCIPIKSCGVIVFRSQI
jgi:hypothetical protein